MVESGRGRHAFASDDGLPRGRRRRRRRRRAGRRGRRPHGLAADRRAGTAAEAGCPHDRLPSRRRRTPSSSTRCASATCSAFAMELVPRISRAQSMDALSSQALVAGYRAALVAAERLPRFFPLFMTAAGTVAAGQGAGARRRCRRAAGDRHRPPARCGRRGVRRAAGLGRRGALDGREVHRPRARGAGGRRRLCPRDGRGAGRRGSASCSRRTSPTADAVITTAAVPGRPAPLLVTARDGRGDAARLGRRRPRRRERRQLRAVRGRARTSSTAACTVWGAKDVPSPMPVAREPALRPQRRQPAAADDHRRRGRARTSTTRSWPRCLA